MIVAKTPNTYFLNTRFGLEYCHGLALGDASLHSLEKTNTTLIWRVRAEVLDDFIESIVERPSAEADKGYNPVIECNLKNGESFGVMTGKQTYDLTEIVRTVRRHALQSLQAILYLALKRMFLDNGDTRKLVVIVDFWEEGKNFAEYVANNVKREGVAA